MLRRMLPYPSLLWIVGLTAVVSKPMMDGRCTSGTISAYSSAEAHSSVSTSARASGSVSLAPSAMSSLRSSCTPVKPTLKKACSGFHHLVTIDGSE